MNEKFNYRRDLIDTFLVKNTKVCNELKSTSCVLVSIAVLSANPQELEVLLHEEIQRIPKIQITILIAFFMGISFTG